MNEKMLEYLEIIARVAGFSDHKSTPELAVALIGSFLLFLGAVFLVLIVYGGFTWMLSAGNETKVLKAKKILTQSVIGTIIIMSSYAVILFVFTVLQEARM